MNDKITGNHILVLRNQMVMAAQEIEPTAEGAILRFRGTELEVKNEDIAQIYETGVINQFPIDPGVLSTLATLERGIALYEGETGSVGRYTLCGASALALTIIPSRSTDDIDVVTTEPLDEFLADKPGFHWDMQVEFMDEGLLRLMGDWTQRTSSAKGPLGRDFLLMHPLDTMMQKMLRWDSVRFEEKDIVDIDEIVKVLNPSIDTIRTLLCENPFRYAQASGPLSVASEAIERNTRLFLERHLPGNSYEAIVREANIRFSKKLQRANLNLIRQKDVDLRQKLKRVDRGME